MAITNKEINLTQLSKELGNKGLIADFTDPNKKLILPADGVQLSDAELDAAIEAHIAVDETAAKAAQRQALLTRLGITEEEARILLGGN
jgi:hypothetical protein